MDGRFWYLNTENNIGADPWHYGVCENTMAGSQSRHDCVFSFKCSGWGVRSGSLTSPKHQPTYAGRRWILGQWVDGRGKTEIPETRPYEPGDITGRVPACPTPAMAPDRRCLHLRPAVPCSGSMRQGAQRRPAGR